MTSPGPTAPRAARSAPGSQSPPSPGHWVDPRGQRLAAALTAVVLAAALVTRSSWVVGVQTGVFAVGVLAGLRFSPYAVLYRRLVRPRLGPPAEWEAAAPPRFAQAVGLLFGLVATVGFAAGIPALGLAATACALAAAFLNAAFGLCLGCEIYLLVRRTTVRTVPTGKGATA